MGTRQFHKTKISVKLPASVQKGNVMSAYSTSSDVTTEGYTGRIQLITHSEITTDMVLCRSKDRKAWVKLKT